MWDFKPLLGRAAHPALLDRQVTAAGRTSLASQSGLVF